MTARELTQREVARMGGRARAKALSKRRRRAIASLGGRAAKARRRKRMRAAQK